MPPAARIGDLHVCPMSDGPKPHVGGPVAIGCPTVMIGFMPAARMGDMCVCVGPPDSIAKGSPTVKIGGMMAARMGDLTAHGGTITLGCPTVMIGEMGMSTVSPVTSLFSQDKLQAIVGQQIAGENSPALRQAMNTLWENRDNPNSPAVNAALAVVADVRGRQLADMQADWQTYQQLLADQRTNGPANGQDEVPGINNFFHGDFMGSTSQLRSGKIVGEAFGIDPVFGALLNPTGGLVGPGNASFDGNDSAVGYHGAVHDAAGYLRNYHNEGPGYDYLGTDDRDTTSPLSGQRNGINYWRESLGENRTRTQRTTDATSEYAMRGVVGVANTYNAAKDAVSEAWDQLFE